MAEKKIISEASSSNSGGDDRGESVLVDVGRSRSSCGYCKSGARSSISYGLWAHSLTVDDYQGVVSHQFQFKEIERGRYPFLAHSIPCCRIERKQKHLIHFHGWSTSTILAVGWKVLALAHKMEFEIRLIKALLDRGWRRSGCFLYKPEMERTCCPSYTIRLKASDFVPSKEQLRVSKRMQRFLDGTLNVKKSGEYVKPSTMDFLVDNGGEKNKLEQVLQYLSDQIDIVLHECIDHGEFPCDIQLPKASVKIVTQAKRKLLVEGSQDLLYSSNISFQIAAALRRANKNVHSLILSGHTEESNKCTEVTPKMIAEKLSSCLNHLVEAFGLSIKACNGHINFYSTAKHAHSEVVVEKVAVSKDSSAGSGGKSSFLKDSGVIQAKGQTLEIRLKRSSFDQEEYALYRRYQIKVHNDTPDRVTESSYRRFLVDSPLVFVPSTGDSTAPPCGFGSFHQQYVINGRLVAVGVIDILPTCLSSKYLFWDPDLAFVSLGKYSALQEIGWVRENQFHCPTLQYYYLGYYIHSCSKMRYKAAYRPSELLCPLRYQWVPFDIAKPLLDQKLYVVLSDFSTLQNGESSAILPGMRIVSARRTGTVTRIYHMLLVRLKRITCKPSCINT